MDTGLVSHQVLHVPAGGTVRGVREVATPPRCEETSITGQNKAHDMRCCSFSLALAGVLLFTPLLPAEEPGETTIGRWCDRMVPNAPEYNRIMEIVITKTGEAVLRYSSKEGSTYIDALREADGGFYEKVESRTGDKYRINPSSGDLQLVDNDGFIRRATRLENTPQQRECDY